jgi:hypothetical protein
MARILPGTAPQAVFLLSRARDHFKYGRRNRVHPHAAHRYETAAVLRIATSECCNEHPCNNWLHD